jgi:pSer/pThr/pTyr-binding forkhead associated (FHA) protein
VTAILRVVSGPAAGASCDVEHEVTIGRENADLTIPDSQVSRRHALVRPVENGLVVEDLGSLNGTFLNGESLSEPVTLTASATLRVGLSEIVVDLGPGVGGHGPDALSTVVAAANPVAAPRRGSVRRIQ